MHGVFVASWWIPVAVEWTDVWRFCRSMTGLGMRIRESLSPVCTSSCDIHFSTRPVTGSGVLCCASCADHLSHTVGCRVKARRAEARASQGSDMQHGCRHVLSQILFMCIADFHAQQAASCPSRALRVHVTCAGCISCRVCKSSDDELCAQRWMSTMHSTQQQCLPGTVYLCGDGDKRSTCVGLWPRRERRKLNYRGVDVDAGTTMHTCLVPSCGSHLFVTAGDQLTHAPLEFVH